MKRFLLALALIVPLSAQAPSEYGVVILESTIIRRAALAEMYASMAKYMSDDYMRGYFDGQAAVWRQLVADIDSVRNER